MPVLELPANPVLSAVARWGVVSSRYVLIREEPRGKVVISLRGGDILEVVNKEDSPEGLWFKVNSEQQSGWVPARDIELYDSLEKAETASEDKNLWN